MPVPCGGRGALWRELLILLVPSPRPLPCPGPRLPGLGVRTDAACTQMPVQWVRFCRSCSEESRTHRGVSAHRPSRVLVPPDGAPHSGCVGACGFPCSPPPRGQGHPPPGQGHRRSSSARTHTRVGPSTQTPANPRHCAAAAKPSSRGTGGLCGLGGWAACSGGPAAPRGGLAGGSGGPGVWGRRTEVISFGTGGPVHKLISQISKCAC